MIAPSCHLEAAWAWKWHGYSGQADLTDEQWRVLEPRARRDQGSASRARRRNVSVSAKTRERRRGTELPRFEVEHD